MFFGQHHRALDENSRLEMPSGFHKALSAGAYVTQGFDRNVWVLPAQAFQEICQRVSAMNLADPQARLLQRMILGAASELDVDGAGGCLIPKNLREFAGLGSEAILVGQGGYFEVWSPAHWREQEIQIQDVETNAQRFATLDITIA
jgi:MraZ protein